MQITYDPEKDQLELRWATGDDPEWRQARRDVHVLVDYDNEPLAVMITRAAAWHCPELRNLTEPGIQQVDFSRAAAEQAHNRLRLAEAITRALADTATDPAWQPQLPWDDPLPTPATINTQAKGLCQWCGAIAPDRRRSTTRCGWPSTHQCPSCHALMMQRTDARTAPPIWEPEPANTPAETWGRNETWSPRIDQIETHRTHEPKREKHGRTPAATE